MNIYIWDFVENLTDSWHNGGGLVVIHNSLDEARKFAALKENCSALTAEPTKVLVCESTEPLVYTFPDSGCC